MDGVPAIIIDPKGDLANLLLTFPGLRGEDFRPWINEEDASRMGQTPDEFAVARVGGVGAGQLAAGGAEISGVADGGAVGCGRDFAFVGEGMDLLYFDVLDAWSRPGESEGALRARLAEISREARDEAGAGAARSVRAEGGRA